MAIYPNKDDGDTGSPEQSIQIHQSTSRHIPEIGNHLSVHHHSVTRHSTHSCT